MWKNDCSMMEIPFEGVSCTWTNNQKDNFAIFKRLDRVYCNNEWRKLFCHAQMTNYPIFLSDHGPILIDYKPERIKKNRPYKLNPGAWKLRK